MGQHRGMGAQKLWQIWQRDLGICQICFRYADIRDSNVDHIIPVAAGGDDSMDNLQLSHAICNNRKGDLGVTEKNPYYHYNKQNGLCFLCKEPMPKGVHDKVRFDKTLTWVPSNVVLMHRPCRIEYNLQFDGFNQGQLKERFAHV